MEAAKIQWVYDHDHPSLDADAGGLPPINPPYPRESNKSLDAYLKNRHHSFVLRRIRAFFSLHVHELACDFPVEMGDLCFFCGYGGSNLGGGGGMLPTD